MDLGRKGAISDNVSYSGRKVEFCLKKNSFSLVKIMKP